MTMTASHFTCFSALPPELRLQVWQQALSVPSVWAAVRVKREQPRGSPGFGFNMVFRGNAPLLAGMASREAHYVLEKLCSRSGGGPGPGPGPCLINFDHTVVYLGMSSDARAVLEGFNTDQLQRFRHVAFSWHHFSTVARTCIRLADLCPNLETIIVRRCRTERVDSPVLDFEYPLGLTLGLETAAYYVDLIEAKGPAPVISRRDYDAQYLLALLREYFGEGAPRLYFPGLERPCVVL